MELFKLVGIVIVILGLVFKFNPLIVVIVAGFATGFAGGMTPVEILDTIGNAFTTNRYMSLFILVLPVIGILERNGLREQAGRLIKSIKGASAGRIMLLYMLFRQVTVALGVSLGGHPSFIRPVVSPMAEAAAAKGRDVPKATLDKIRGMAASSENFGNFFGQNLFIAAGGLLLIKGVFDSAGYEVALTKMALYCLPSAVAAFIFAAVRYTLFDRSIEKEIAAAEELSAKGGDK